MSGSATEAPCSLKLLSGNSHRPREQVKTKRQAVHTYTDTSTALSVINLIRSVTSAVLGVEEVYTVTSF